MINEKIKEINLKESLIEEIEKMVNNKSNKSII
jgi:hypothetical protein